MKIINKPLFWLLLGFIIFPFTKGIHGIAILTWLLPIFFLRFTRSTSPLKGFLLLSLSIALGGCFVSYFYALEESLIIVMLVGIIASPIVALPYLIDRLLFPKFKDFKSTFVFPLAIVALRFPEYHFIGTFEASELTQTAYLL